MRFPLSLDQLNHMLEYIRNQADCDGVPPVRAQKLELAAEEALVNIISYGHPSAENTVEIDCEKKQSHFIVRLIDWGPPFNPIEADIDIQQGVSLNERKIGGLGIHLFRKLVDEAIYFRDEEKNILMFTLRLEVV